MPRKSTTLSSLAKAAVEDLTRAKLLASSSRKRARKVGKLLCTAVGDGAVLPSGASRIAWLDLHGRIAPSALAALNGNQPLFLVTILFGTADLAVANISDLDLKKLHARLRMLLRRHGLGDRVVFGVFEFDYLEWRKVFLTTLHMIVPAATKADFEALRETINKTTPKWLKRPLQAKNVTDLRGLIGYVMKGCIVAKRRYRQKTKIRSWSDVQQAKKSRKRTRKIRLIGERGRAALLWQHQYEPRDFLFLQRMRL